MKISIVDLLALYDAKLESIGIVCVNHSNDKYWVLPSYQLEHARWMIGEMISNTVKFSKDTTTNRWLGYMQGILSANNIYSIQVLRDQSRGLND